MGNDEAGTGEEARADDWAEGRRAMVDAERGKEKAVGIGLANLCIGDRHIVALTIGRGSANESAAKVHEQWGQRGLLMCVCR